eukprot:6482426-Alexandrium_andersonii.AAC.1
MALFGRDTADGLALVRAVFALTTGGGRIVCGVEYSKVSDVRFPPACPRLFDGPRSVGLDVWR